MTATAPQAPRRRDPSRAGRGRLGRAQKKLTSPWASLAGS